MKLSYKHVAVAALPLVLAACGGDDNQFDAKVHYHGAKTTLSGKVLNAVTNAPLSDDSLEVKLFQGAKVRKAKLVKNEDGYYSISGIPTNTSNNPNEFRIEVSADGYLDLQGAVSFGYSETDYSTNVQDKKFSKIGNINLYPVGFKTPDYDVVVTYNNNRVADVDVVAELTNPAASVNAVANSQGSLITAIAPDNVTRLTATTDANGVATFAGSALVLGANYSLSVLPVEVNGVDVQDIQNESFVVGEDNVENTINLSKLSSATAEGLLVKSATNEYQDAIPAEGNNGKLVITFSKPVTVVGDVNASLSNATNAALETPSPTEKVVNVSGNGTKVITLTPNFATAPTDDDEDLFVTFEDLLVNIDGVNKVVQVLNSLGQSSSFTSSGINLTGKVQITLP